MTNPIATALESIFKYQTCQRCEDVVLSAVNEIEVLTLERDKARRERDDAQVDQKLIEELWERRTEMTEMKAQMKQLTKERDHARRLFCEWSAGSDRPGEAKEDIARSNGWSDLYEKKTP